MLPCQTVVMVAVVGPSNNRAHNLTSLRSYQSREPFIFLRPTVVLWSISRMGE